MATSSFKAPCVDWTQIFLKYSMLGNRIFLVQHAKTRQAMRNALFSCCSLLKDLLLSEHLSCMLLLSEPHSGRASSPKTFPSPASHHSPFPILAQWFCCAHLFSAYSPPSPKSDEDGKTPQMVPVFLTGRSHTHTRSDQECCLDLYFSRQLDMTLLVS